MPGFIDDMMTLVTEVLQKHDPALRDRAELESFLVARPRPRGQYGNRTHEQLVEDFNKICDKLAASIRERDELRGLVAGSQRRLDALNMKFWIVSGVLVGEGAVIYFLAKELFARIP